MVLAKCDDLDWLDEIGSTIPSPVPLSPLIESALGLRRLDALCAHPRVTQCHLGEIDLLGRPGRPRRRPDPSCWAMPTPSCSSRRRPPESFLPSAGSTRRFRDLEGLAADSARLAQLGFAGRPALHPSQVPVINAAFRPSADELAAAAALVASYDEALGVGRVW